MRPAPELAGGRTPIQVALARVRLPTGPRACELAAIAVCVLVAVLVLTPLTLLRDLPNAYDTDAFYAPFAAFLHERLSHGDFPLWNPFAFSGHPFAADPQSGVLYPPALVSYGLLAPASGMVALVTFHYLLATLSSYAFARLCGAGRLGAVYAGIAFGAGGYLLARSQALGLLTGAAWLAASVAAAQYAATRQGRGASPLILAGTLALSILGGSQQLTLVAATSALVVLVLQLRWRGLAVFAGAGAVALGLAAVAILPRLELVSLSSASTGVSDPAGVGELAWSDADLVFGCIRVARGRARAALRRRAHAGARRNRGHPPLERRARAAGARDRGDPLVGRAGGLPRASVRPAALDHLASGRARAPAARARARGTRRNRVRPAGLTPVAVARRGARRGHRPRDRAGRARAQVVARPGDRDADPPGAPALAAHARGRARLCARAGGARDRSRAPRLPAAEPASARGELASRLRDVSRAHPRPRASCWPGGRPRGRRASRRSANDFTLRKQLRFGRSAEHRNLLLDMAGTRYGLEDVAGYDPVQLLAYRDAINASNGNPQPDRHFLWVEVAPKRLLRELGVRYYVAQDGTGAAQAEGRAAHADRHRAARRQGAADRADQPPGRTRGIPVARRARIVVREPDRVVVESPPGPAGRLVLADPPYPGWSVTVDGKPRPSASSAGSSAPSTSPRAPIASSGASSPRA